MMFYTSKPRPAPPSPPHRQLPLSLSLSLYIPIVTTSPGSLSLSFHPHTQCKAYRRQVKAAQMISPRRPKTSFINIRPPDGALRMLLLPPSSSPFFIFPLPPQSFTRLSLASSYLQVCWAIVAAVTTPRQNSPNPCRAPFCLPVTLPRLPVCYLDV